MQKASALNSHRMKLSSVSMTTELTARFSKWPSFRPRSLHLHEGVHFEIAALRPLSAVVPIFAVFTPGRDASDCPWVIRHRHGNDRDRRKAHGSIGAQLYSGYYYDTSRETNRLLDSRRNSNCRSSASIASSSFHWMRVHRSMSPVSCPSASRGRS
jgi:hypothetical protein